MDNAAKFRTSRPETVTLPNFSGRTAITSRGWVKLFHYGVPTQIGTSGLDDPESWDEVVNPRGRDKDDEDKIVTIKPGSGFGTTLSWLAADWGGRGTDRRQRSRGGGPPVGAGS